MSGLSIVVADPQSCSVYPVVSRGGDPSSLAILESRGVGCLLYIPARDSSGGIRPGVSNTYWRALFDLNGRLVAAEVVGTQQRPIMRDTRIAKLDSLIDRLRHENASLTVAPEGA